MDREPGAADSELQEWQADNWTELLNNSIFNGYINNTYIFYPHILNFQSSWYTKTEVIKDGNKSTLYWQISDLKS